MPSNAIPLTQYQRPGTTSHLSHRKRSSGTSRPMLSTKLASSKTLNHKAGGPSSDDDEMSSFQQFCATCDKLILVPSASILYCSETCRRQDHSILTSVSPIRHTADSSGSPKPEPDLIPPLSPTELSRTSIFNSHKDSRVSLDEMWARDATDPGRSSPTRNGQHISRADSEAALYLSQFHSDPAVNHRPRMSRHSAAPSLSCSATSFASSLAFTPVTGSRSLGNRFVSRKSVELVTPVAAETPYRDRFAEALDEKVKLEDWERGPAIMVDTLGGGDESAGELVESTKLSSGDASTRLKQLLAADSGKSHT